MNVVKELAKIDRIYALDGRLPALKASLWVIFRRSEINLFLSITMMFSFVWDFGPFIGAVMPFVREDVVILPALGALMPLVGFRMLFWYDVYRGYTFVDAEIEEGDTELAQGLAYIDDLLTGCTDNFTYVTARAVELPGFDRS